MNGYLLDTNVISRWFSGHANVLAHIHSLPNDTPLQVSVIAIGEVEFGHQITRTTDLDERDRCSRFIANQFPAPLDVTKHVVSHYGDSRAQLFRDYPPQGKKQNHPERCHDTVTASDLEIDENDLWMAAQAITHNLVFVSNDKKILERIRTASNRVLDVEDWELPLT